MLKLIGFGRDVKREAQKITWPTRKETGVTTLMIVVMAMVAAVFFFVADGVIGTAVQMILGVA